MRHARILLWSWIVIAAWPALAFADAGVVVEDFKGASGRKVRSIVTEILEDEGVTLVPPKKAKLTAKKSGADLTSESGRVRVAKKLNVNAFIEGTTKVVKKKTEISIRVYRGSDGMQAAEYKTQVAKTAFKRELTKNLWAAIGSALGGGVAAEPIEDMPETKPAPSREPVATAPQRQQPPARQQTPAWETEEADDELPPGVAPKRQPSREPTHVVEQARDEEGEEALALESHPEEGGEKGPLPSAFDVTVGARIGTRSFGYNDSLPGLRGYSLLPSPSLALIGHWYPAAHFSAGALANIGLDVRADMLVGVSSENKDGEKFSTSSHALGFGLRGRIPLEALELGVVGGWGQHTFSVSNSGKVDPDIPDIAYSFIRLGADARYQFNRSIALQLRAAYLVGMSLGEIASKAWFPHASGNGVEAEASFQLGVSRLLALELAVGMQRYFMSLNPSETDPGVLGSTARVAGGALDKYFSTRLGLIIRP